MKKLQLPATVTVKELADRLSVSGPQLIKYLMGNGVMATLNQSVDFDTAALAADHFGFEAESEEAAAGAPRRPPARAARNPLLDLSGADPATLQPRAPVVDRPRPRRPRQDLAPRRHPRDHRRRR